MMKLEESFNYVGWPEDEPITAALILENVRFHRAMLLEASDWTQLPDSPLTSQQRQAWADYRQALRDLPEQVTDPRKAVWPTRPE
jgi:hypothetical protein